MIKTEDFFNLLEHGCPFRDVIAHNPTTYVQRERATEEIIVASKVTTPWDPTLVHAFINDM